MATPYELLLGMSLLREKKRIQHNEEHTESEGNSFLQVPINNDDVLIRQTDIEEIIPVALITQMPNMQEWFKGLTSYRGNLLPLVDLAVLLTGKPTKRKGKKNNEARILIIKALDNFLGLYVQKVDGIQHHWLHKGKTQEDNDTSGMARYCRYYQKQNKDKVSVLAVDEIRRSRDFLNV